MTTKAEKHTPGPWQKLDTCFEVKADPLFWRCGVKAGGVRVADASGIGQEQAEANAHLIASAPELLEAVKKLHNEYAHQGKGYWAGTGQAIERLINHATGKA